MAARRSSTVCLSCRCQASVTSRRRIQHSVRKSLQAVALQHDGHEQPVSQTEPKADRYESGVLQSITDAMVRQWNLNIPIEDSRREAKPLEATTIHPHGRLKVPHSLLCISPPQRPHNRYATPDDSLRLPEAQAAHIPHTTFREIMRRVPNVKQTRQALRAQLLRVHHPKDLLRVVAVAMQNRSHAEQLSVLYEPVMRALYRCRGTVTDTQILGTISTIVARFRFAGLVPHYQLLTVGMKFAARARSVAGMKKYLRLIHERDGTMTSNIFRSVIAKFSIGHRGLGEIRNGRWRRSDLMQVLTGFDDCKDLSANEQYHLGVFLQRHDWQFLHGWIAVLARCKASDEVWAEWLLWKQNPARTNPKRLNHAERFMNTQWRGDYWFVEQMTCTGDVARAWRMLEGTAIPFSTLKGRMKARLLDGAEHASIWTPQMSSAMFEKYDADLSQIERAFGVAWKPGTEDGEGQHVLFRDQEEALDELGAPEWKVEEDYGFPTDDTPLSSQERCLHDAQEGMPVLAESETRRIKISKQHDINDLRLNG